MVSPEMLRRYPFFGALEDAQLKAVAMLSEEENYEKGQMIFEECGQANQLFILIDGSVDLYYRSQEEYPTKDSPPPKEFAVGEINPGEVFGISALIEPFSYNATARAERQCRVVQVDAVALRKMFESDIHLAYKMMAQATKTTMERMAGLRAQLAAAWS